MDGTGVGIKIATKPVGMYFSKMRLGWISRGTTEQDEIKCAAIV